ncbi:winged helix-turn-helix transcriptional regulator [Methanococcoides orientis]|uniref:helix-turn-helix transcriptional regulator n=1 Tax=Methanococcoides orientis TaxID=2822137 RepID=UPI001E2AB394|nr:winged helix-turn-helix transcriptional regulator [Methanococcoides orientis]UGV41548.1 winged helix-turn-helix transcriptional regulator [Methanococcoides orientis]
MKTRHSILFLFILIIMLPTGMAAANSSAIVHGATYEWNTFEPLENTIIQVNSTPPQSFVAKYGTYSFDLNPGSYTITARYYQNDTLIYLAEEDIVITDGGSYVIDLLLYPAYSEGLITEEDLAEIAPVKESLIASEKNNQSSISTYSIVAIVIALAMIGAYSFMHKKKGTDHVTYQLEVVAEPEEEKEEFPSDLQEVLDIIIANGGRITQKDLRSKIKYSEGKVSLMLSELEAKGYVEKFRKGRGNVIILKDRK